MSAMQHGMPGEWAKVRGTVLSLWPLFLCFIALGACGAAIAMGRHVALFLSLFATSMVATALFWRKGLRRVESFFKGALGEERVAELLAGLPRGYHVFHDFVACGHHVDHVVVGPAGVFSVETKCWRGQVTVEDGELLQNGTLPGRSPLAQAKKEAAAVKASLARSGWNGDVRPVVCFASDTFQEGSRDLNMVTVLNANGVREWISGQPSVIGVSEVERLAQLMDTCL